MVGVLVVQGRGRLVEDQELDLLRERLGDLDELLLADAGMFLIGVIGFSLRPTRARSFAASWLVFKSTQPRWWGLFAQVDVWAMSRCC